MAAAIKKLARPTTSAWLANRLVRDRGAALDQLLALGSAMRSAQSNLKADDLRQMSGQRHKIVNEFVTQARTLAANSGIAMSAAVERELTATLEAAIADEASSQSLRAGHLAASLSYSGFGAPTLAAPEGGRPAEDAPPNDGGSPLPDVETPPAVRDPVSAQQDASRRQARRAAQAALREARAAAVQRRRQVAERQSASDAARARCERLAEAAAELEAQLASARRKEVVAARTLKEALQAAEAAARQAEEADERVSEQQDLVARLSDDDPIASVRTPQADAID